MSRLGVVLVLAAYVVVYQFVDFGALAQVSTFRLTEFSASLSGDPFWFIVIVSLIALATIAILKMGSEVAREFRDR